MKKQMEEEVVWQYGPNRKLEP